MPKTELVSGLKIYDVNGYVILIRSVVDVSWRLDGPNGADNSRLTEEEEGEWGGQDSRVWTPPLHNKCHFGNGSAAESPACGGAQSVQSPPTATEVSAHPFFNQLETPSPQSLAEPPQSLSGNSNTGKAPSRSAFESEDFRYPGRYKEDKEKLEEWKGSKILDTEDDVSKLGELKKREIADIRNLSLT